MGEKHLVGPLVVRTERDGHELSDVDRLGIEACSLTGRSDQPYESVDIYSFKR